MKNNFLLLSLILFSSASSFAATDISNVPISGLSPAKPNIIIALDNSGSMDYEVLLNSNDGAAWWNENTHSFFNTKGQANFNQTGNNGQQSDGDWYKYVYLFPNGTTQDARIYPDSNGMYAIPPIPAFAFIRSSDYNPIYYNPKITYTPWLPAYINNASMSFTNVTPTAARSHPLAPSSGSPFTFNLTQNISSTTSDHTFYMLPGMIIPGNLISGIQAQRVGSSTWTNITTSFTIPAGQSYNVNIPYYPATYYVKDSTCTSGPTCVTAPDGNQLRQYQILPGNTFPSGRSYTAEMQNFANWFEYYRKRKMMLASAAGQAYSSIHGIKVGIVLFNNLNPVTMYDFDSTNPANNCQALLAPIYLNLAGGGTPTRNALNYVGNQFMTNKNIIQYACQVNAAMVFTDGFADISSPTIPSYQQSTWVGKPPYTTIFSESLAAIASAYYTVNLRPDLTPTGLVPTSTTGSNPDLNPNLHMETYALTLAPQGTIYNTGTPQALNPFANPPTWPNPDINASPTAVDDLWHATINGRGIMTNASDSTGTLNALSQIVTEVLLQAGAAASVGTSNIFLNSSSVAYVSNYQQSYGNLMAYAFTTSGGINLGAMLWSASNLLSQKTPTSRVIATYNGSTGIPFEWASLTSGMQTALTQALYGTTNLTTAQAQLLLNWLRGDKSNEGTLFRTRTSLLGDIVDAAPVPVNGAVANYADPSYAAFSASIQGRQPMVYQGADDGMLHAFNATSGQEQWAYVPSLVFNQINQLANPFYIHRFYVDGTPTVADVESSSGNWSTILVGGLQAGGSGFYALDVTYPIVSSESNLTNHVLWEFPNNSTSATVKSNVGLSFGNPVIVETQAAGWVVLVTSGYNTTGDGLGHLFVLDPFSGSIIKELVTSSGTSTNQAGLAKLSAFAVNGEFDPLIDYVYGGDLLGNVWRFDLSGPSIQNWNVKLLAQLTDATGKAQPVTSAPELAIVNNKRFVFVGTGELLGQSDLSNTSQQTMYALVDNMSANPTITPLRENLQARQIAGNLLTGQALDLTDYSGWYLDFPIAGERVNTNPVIAYGALIFNTNYPTITNCDAESFEYLIDINTGLTRAASTFGTQAPWARQLIADSLTSAPTIIVTSTGQVIAVNHNSNNTIAQLNIPNLGGNSYIPVAWKEVFKQN